MIELVNTQTHLSKVVDQISTARRVAIDTESNAYFKYHERICLVQLAIAETAFLIDPLAIHDLKPLGEVFDDSSIEKIFHAGDNDLRGLDRDYGFHARNLFDTSTAATLVDAGPRAGLQTLVKIHAGVELAKPLNIQRSDWSIRPLNLEALKYAANDVLYLS